MKRAIAMLLTFAMVGSLMFMGFAGTAAAQDVDVDIGGDGGDGGHAGNYAEVNQQNNNAQIGISEATATSGGADDTNEKPYNNNDEAADSTSATSSVDQTQDVTQSNDASVDQNAEAGDGGDGGAVNVELGLLGVL
ncbi:hypothetical protein SAMN04487967_1648 [Natronorubrum sediminis]|uniref:Uncharacterized protein n=1 Tax=Natronorubrum sediminis TaxID=640943 RepID=A0A1H6FXR9_9EURY|nr:hypothetical protein [Natronorubrum sediminis]SEH14535.1 hypothetical protein SAMN04487967_1648 [Natronorubrum sediminis]